MDVPIALDASLWDEPTTGIGQYTRCLAGALEAQGERLLRLGARTSGEHPRGAVPATLFTLGVLPRILRERNAPLFHAHGNFNLPLVRSDTRTVVTVHDLIPLLLPDTVSLPFRMQFRLWLSRTLQVADEVVCVSEDTRRTLLARFPGLNPERLHVVHNGVDHVEAHPLDADGAAELEALRLPERFLLFAGALDARKNVARVLDACAALHRAGRPVTLVLAGQRWFGSGPVEQRVAAMRAEGLDLRPVGFQPANVLYALMARATALVFPSRYEGFGLPPLEAMWLGTPAIVSDRGALPEVCGPQAIQLAPDDVEALAGAIARLLQTPAERRARSEAGQVWARQFTWARAARDTVDVYERALRRPRP
jgi:glycosyltransferase involved in cell wall biosynthesis